MSMLNTSKSLQDLINFTDIYDINNIAFLSTVDHIVVKSTTGFQKFYPYVKQYLTTYKVTPEQREKYRCRPDLLSTDVYGTPTLDWFIMWMNGQECPSKFKIKQTIILVAPDSIQELFITIKNKNNVQLERNWTEHLVE